MAIYRYTHIRWVIFAQQNLPYFYTFISPYHNFSFSQLNSTSQASRVGCCLGRAARPNTRFLTWLKRRGSKQNNRAEIQHSKSAKNSKVDPVLPARSSQLVLGNRQSESEHVAKTLPGRCVRAQLNASVRIPWVRLGLQITAWFQVWIIAWMSQ